MDERDEGWSTGGYRDRSRNNVRGTTTGAILSGSLQPFGLAASYVQLVRIERSFRSNRSRVLNATRVYMYTLCMYVCRYRCLYIPGVRSSYLSALPFFVLFDRRSIYPIFLIFPPSAPTLSPWIFRYLFVLTRRKR